MGSARTGPVAHRHRRLPIHVRRAAPLDRAVSPNTRPLLPVGGLDRAEFRSKTSGTAIAPAMNPQPPNLARRRRVRRTGVRADVRPCRGAARAYIYDVCIKIAIINPSIHANISIKRPCAKFRCQSPASPILAHKIPLPKSSAIRPQAIDIIVVFGCWGRFQDAKKADFPAIREDTATRRRRGGGFARR